MLRKKGVLVAIEVKSNAEKRTKGLAAFSEKFNPRHAFIVGDGGVSVKDFLSLDLNGLF